MSPLVDIDSTHANREAMLPAIPLNVVETKELEAILSATRARATVAL